MERQGVDGPLVLGRDLEPLLGADGRDPDDGSHGEEAGRGPSRPLPSPAVAPTSAGHQLIVLEGKLGPYFTSLDSNIESLQKRAQDLIENINESRQKDHSLMSNFRDNLKTKISEMTEKLEEKLYQVYNHHNKIIQEKLQEFTQKMAKISNLEMELKQVCHSVENVYKDLCVQPEVQQLHGGRGSPGQTDRHQTNPGNQDRAEWYRGEGACLPHCQPRFNHQEPVGSPKPHQEGALSTELGVN